MAVDWHRSKGAAQVFDEAGYQSCGLIGVLPVLADRTVAAWNNGWFELAPD